MKNVDSVDSLVIEAEKEIRPILNKVSEGNIDPMWQSLQQVFQSAVSKGKTKLNALFQAYAKNFIILATSQ